MMRIEVMDLLVWFVISDTPVKCNSIIYIHEIFIKKFMNVTTWTSE